MGTPQPKPSKTIAQRKAKRRRDEHEVLREVWSKVMARDTHCRAVGIGTCRGNRLMAHMQGYRRAHTRNLPPEQRHDPRWCLALCKRHGAMEEARELRVVYLTDSWCDGPVSWEVSA